MCRYCPRKETHGDCLILGQCTTLARRFITEDCGNVELASKLALLIAVLRRILPPESPSGKRSDRIDRWKAYALENLPVVVRFEASRLSKSADLVSFANAIEIDRLMKGIDCPKLDAMISTPQGEIR